MKHLKLFENYNGFYEKIDGLTYLDISDESKQDKDCFLTEYQKEWLVNNLPFSNWAYSENPKWIGTTNNPKEIATGMYCVSVESCRLIHKVEDEYFLCSLNEDEGITYYKCDQWEGLIQLLKDKSIGCFWCYGDET
jgi:hypothetical protein